MRSSLLPALSLLSALLFGAAAAAQETQESPAAPAADPAPAAAPPKRPAAKRAAPVRRKAPAKPARKKRTRQPPPPVEEPPPEPTPPPEPPPPDPSLLPPTLPEEPAPPAAPEVFQRSVAFSGKLLTQAYAFADPLLRDELLQLSTSAWLAARARLTPEAELRMRLVLDSYLASALGRAGQLQPRLREAYFLVSHQGVELRGGQLIVPWGNADVFNPTDVLTAKDYGYLASDPDLQTIGATGALVSWTPGEGSSPLTLTAVWLPVFARGTPLVPPGALPPGVSLAPEGPRPSLATSEVGAQADYSGEGWDVGAMVFRGWSHQPVFLPQLDPADPMTMGVAGGFFRTFVSGLEASVSAGDWVLRFEGAYRRTIGFEHQALLPPSNLDAVLGVERPFFERLRVGVQLLARHHLTSSEGIPQSPDDPLAALREELRRANALLHDFAVRDLVGNTLRVAYTTASEDLEVSLFAVARWTAGDGYLRPQLSYRFMDGGRVLVGADYYGGNKDRMLGSLHPFRSFNIETHFSF